MQEAFEKITDRLAEQHRKNRYESHNDEWNVGIDQAEQIVNEVAAEYNNGWIPCSERLPEESGDYTVTEEVRSMRTDNRILQTRVVGEVGFADGKWRRANHLKIIAWQPLPQPYEPRED